MQKSLCSRCDPATSVNEASMKQDFSSFLLMKNCFLMLWDCTFSIWIRALILSRWAEWLKDIAKSTNSVFKVHEVQKESSFHMTQTPDTIWHSKQPNVLILICKPICLIDRLSVIEFKRKRDWWVFASLFHVNCIHVGIPVCKSLCQEHKYALKDTFLPLSRGSPFSCQTLVWSTWKPDSGSAALFIKAQISMERRQISSLPVLKDCWSRTTHPQPLSFPFSPSLSLLCDLDSIHPLPSVFRCRFGTLWWMNPWLLDLGPKRRVSYLVIPSESSLYGLVLGCRSWTDTACLRTLFAST